MCKVYSRVWETNRTRAELVEAHSYYLGDERPDRPRYLRLEKWFAAEPRRHPTKPCRCGSPDRWKCWSKVYAREVLGQARAHRGQLFRVDWELVAAMDPMVITNGHRLAEVIEISTGHLHEPTVHSSSGREMR